jgi:hypothetical protein
VTLTKTGWSAVWTFGPLGVNETAKQHKTGANQMELQNVYVLQFVKYFIIYYIKCVCPRIWISRVYFQKLRCESVKKISTKNS